jgi:hypothetical protein
MQEPSHSANYVPVTQESTGVLLLLSPHISLGLTLQQGVWQLQLFVSHMHEFSYSLYVPHYCITGSPPGPVRNLILTTPITATTLTITWDASSGFPDRYEVTYSYTVKRCSATGGPLTINISDVSMRSYTRTLSNLNEDSSYTINNRFYFQLGISKMGQSVK